MSQVAPEAGLPRYLEIRRDLEERIASGEWPPGRRIPPEHELQALYGCSRMTVSKALSALAEAGLITRNRRAGSIVAQPRSEESVLEIQDIKAEIVAAGRPYRFEILSRRERKANGEDARRLALAPGTTVLALRVLHFAGARPHVLEDRLLNLDAVPAARRESFDEQPPGTWLLALVPWTEAEHVISADNATAAVARHLAIAEGTACLVIERRTFRAGATLTFVRLTHPGGRHRLVSRFNPRQS